VSSRTNSYESLANLPRYSSWLAGQDWTDAYRRHRRNLQLIPGNNIGFFGPYEALWERHYGGCVAGENTWKWMQNLESVSGNFCCVIITAL